MAIQVGGTTVIDNSRNLTNVGGLKTINGTSVLGSGNISAGASTSTSAVGTYIWGRPQDATNYAIGYTASGLYAVIPNAGPGGGAVPVWKHGMSGWGGHVAVASVSGTWRTQTGAYSPGSGTYSYQSIGLWQRIS